MKPFEFQTLNSPLKLDVSIFQSHLNTNLTKINSAIQYLLTQINQQQQANLQTYTSQENHFISQRQEIDSVKVDHQMILDEIYGSEEGEEEGGEGESQLGDEKGDIGIGSEKRVKTKTKGKRVSKINSIQNEIKKIKQVMRQEKEGRKEGLSRLQSRGKTNVDNIASSPSQIRIREGSRGKQGGSRLGSRAQSRKKLANQMQERRYNGDGYGDKIDLNQSGTKSMYTSFMKRKGSKTYINFKDKNQDEQDKNFNTNSNRRIEDDFQNYLNSRLKEMEANYEKRLETIEKKLKIKNKQGGGGIKFQENRNSGGGNQQTENQNQLRNLSANNESNEAQKSNNQQSEEWTDPLQKQYQQIKILLSQTNNKLQKQQVQQKQISKRSSDILLKFQKNHERVTAALKYLQRNISKIYQKLKQANIIQQGQIIELNDSKDGKPRERISQLVRLNDKSSEQEKLLNRLETLDNLMKNIEEQMSQLKYTMGIASKKTTLPRINNKENGGRIKQFQFSQNFNENVNLKFNELETEMDKMKIKLKSVSVGSDELSLKFLELSSKIREQTEVREQRLIELIKEIVNRTLSDPFDNHFTNQLKKEIYVKFLEIKHEYGAIWKEIEKKVEDRVSRKELEYLGQKWQTGVLEVRSGLGKKVDGEDNRKWVRFVEGRLKELAEAIKMSQSNQYKLVQEHTLSIKKKEKDRGDRERDSVR